MKFPGGFNIQQMMKQAQVMQEKMSKEMEELRTEASAGGGVVTVEMKGNHEIVSLKISHSFISPGFGVGVAPLGRPAKLFARFESDSPVFT